MQVIKLIKIVPLLAISCYLFISGCAMTGGQMRQPLFSAEKYLELADASQGYTRQNYLLKAANRLILDRNPIRAQHILNTIDNNQLTPDLSTKKQMLQANIYLLQNRVEEGLSILNQIRSAVFSLSRADQAGLYELLAYAYQKQGDTLISLDYRTQLMPLLPDDASRKQNSQTIWRSLQTVDRATLSQYLSSNPSPELRGWIALALLDKQSGGNPAQFEQQLTAWRNLYPNHPGNALFANPEAAMPGAETSNPSSVALLLPLQGSLSAQATVIRNGFFAAYYDAKERQPNTPNIMVMDTSHGNIADIYQQALARGAHFIVGPLSKSELSQLAQTTRLSVPTLALNALPNLHERPVPNLYQFALSPIDEAQQMATKARRDNHHQALLIAPANSWGRGVAQALVDQWQSNGGHIVGEMYYSKQQSLANNIANLLQIDQGAENRASRLKHKYNKKIHYVPKVRTDADVIFLIAQPNMARQIRPLLKYYYAENIPVYATSAIYTGVPNPNNDRDLDGIMFCDMPWVLTPMNLQPNYLNNIETRIQILWPSSYNQHRKLYAFGVDAYNIVMKLNHMSSQWGTAAATGTLYLTPDHYIYRKVIWAKMIDGVPQV